MTGDALDHNDTALLTVNEAAERLGVKPKTIRRWLERGIVTRRYFQGRLVVSDRELLDAEHRTRLQRRGPSRGAPQRP